MNGATPQPRRTIDSRQLQQTIRRLWDWWLGELGAMLPPDWRRHLQGQGKPLLISCESQQCIVRLGTDDQQPIALPLHTPPSGLVLQQLAERRNKVSRIILLLPSEQVLVKQLHLPDATAANLANVLKFEMDKLTPFQAEQVYYGYRVLDRDKVARRIRVELMLTSKAALQPLLQRLGEWQLVPTVITPAPLNGLAQLTVEKMVNLLPQEGGPQPPRLLLLRRLRAAAILLLLGLAVAMPYLQRQKLIEQLQASLVEPREKALQTGALKQQMRNLQQARQFLITRKAAGPSMLLLLKEVTVVLPDDTWLSRFEVKSGLVRLQGESDNASALIGLLEQSPLLQDARFSSPVTVNPQTRKERFVIEARIAARGEAS